jgi:hypothetical protein
MGIGRRATMTMLCFEGIWQTFDDGLRIVTYAGHSCLSAAKFERFVSSDMKIEETGESPTLSVV